MKVEHVLGLIPVGLLGISLLLSPLACAEGEKGTKEEAAVTEAGKAKTEGKTKEESTIKTEGKTKEEGEKKK